MPAGALALALASAVCLAGHFLSSHRSLWDDGHHDRNAHYLYNLKLATHLRAGRALSFVDEVQRARVWPPLHGLLGALILVIGGLDYRLAVLPSLAGWIMAVLFAALLARRVAPRGGDVAGSIAALLVLVSPAHRAYATDIMLESLGAGLTLLVLYCYAVAAQRADSSPWPGRWLGLALTALFLHKYNYWLLAVLALLGTEALRRGSGWWRGARSALARVDWRAWGGAQLRHPFTYLLALLFLIVVGVERHGDRPVEVAGLSVNLFPPHNIVQLAYWVLFLRLLIWWRGSMGAWALGLDVRLRPVVRWHVVPIAFWMLLPKHASYFLWYLSPANAGDSQRSDVLAGLREYGTWAIEDYHPASWAAVLVAALGLVALLCWRRLRPGGQAVLGLVLIAASLSVVHPNRKARNLHSWLAGAWVAAGVGLAGLVHGRATVGAARARPWLGGAAVAALGCATWPALLGAGRAAEGGPHPQRASLLDLTDCYLREVDGARRAAVFTTVPLRPLAQWTVLERYGGLDRLEERWDGFGAPGTANRDGLQRWLATTACDLVVFVDRTGRAPGQDSFPECRAHGELRNLLFAQRRFRLVQEQAFPRHVCKVLIWRRGPLRRAAPGLSAWSRRPGRLEQLEQRHPGIQRSQGGGRITALDGLANVVDVAHMVVAGEAGEPTAEPVEEVLRRTAHDELAAGPQEGREAPDGLVQVGHVLQHVQGGNHVEGARREGGQPVGR
jgi:hypothetical protein